MSDSIKKAVNAKQDNNYDALTDIANSLNTPKDLNTVFKKAKVSKQEAAFLLPYSSVWTSKLNKIAHPIENSTENLTNYEVATKGLKDSKGGLVAIGTVLKTALMNPMTWIAGTGIAAIGRMIYKATEFDRAINATSKSQSVFASASNELSTLNSQLDATASRISELKALKAQGNLSPSESSELEALNLQNSELELQIQLKKRSAAQLSDAAVKNAISALRQKTQQTLLPMIIPDLLYHLEHNPSITGFTYIIQHRAFHLLNKPLRVLCFFSLEEAIAAINHFPPSSVENIFMKGDFK